MKGIMCCLAIFTIQHGSSEMDCTEPQLLVKETYCGYDNMTSLTMYTLNEELKANIAETLPHEGCGIDFIEPYLNNTFYIECQISETNCYDEDRKDEKVKRDTYYLECEEVDLFENYTTVTFAYSDINASATEMDTFPNETTTDLTVVSTDATVNSTDANDFSNESTVSDDSWSILDVFGNRSASSTEMDTFANETTTDLGVILTDATVNSTDADDFSNESTVTHDSWSTLDVIGKVRATTTEIEVLRNETAISALKKVKKDSPDPSKVLLVLGYSAAGLGAAVGMAFGVRKLRILMQSGTYLFPSTPSPPGFIELA